jgi:quercetin dioxygenase-like cupin family protein
MSTSSTTHLGAGQGAAIAHRSIWYAGRQFTVLATAAETDGRCSVVEEVVQRGISLDLPPRVQTGETLCAYVLEGELTVDVGGAARHLTAGDCVAVPAGTAHRFDLVSDSARVLHVYAPGGFEGFFRDLGQPGGLRPRTPLDVERLVSVAASYGVEIVAAAL